MTPPRIDPVTLEVVRNALVAAVMEMTENLIRTAYSPVAAEIKDFSIGLLDAAGNSIAQAPSGVPMFVADLGTPIKKGLVLFGEEGFAESDIVLSNDAATNGQHLNNMVAFSPIVWHGEVIAFAAVRSHWTDVGGVAIGSTASQARDIFAEGFQLPFVKVYRAGKPDAAILRIIETNTRFPDMVMGDMRAQISACRLGERRFLELVSRYGSATVDACIHRIWDEGEAVARRAVELIPDGTYEASCFLDDDGVTRGWRIPLKVRIVVQGSDMTIDFSEMSPEVGGPYNSRAHETIARVAFKYITTPDLAINEGGFRNCRIVAPEGIILNASPTAAMGSFNMAVVSTIDLILRALQPALPDRITAGNADNIGLASMTGRHPTTQRIFHTFVPYIGGLGARPSGDGTSAVVSLVQGDVHFLPVEMQETHHPVRIHKMALRCDSGGAGTFRGGLGVELEREALVDCHYHARYERTVSKPWGFNDGQPGKVTTSFVRAADTGIEAALPTKGYNIPFKKGDIEHLFTAGGGGIGNPLERDPERVRRDVINGYVSLEAARAGYGVVLSAALEVDCAQTEGERREQAGKIRPE